MLGLKFGIKKKLMDGAGTIGTGMVGALFVVILVTRLDSKDVEVVKKDSLSAKYVDEIKNAGSVIPTMNSQNHPMNRDMKALEQMGDVLQQMRVACTKLDLSKQPKVIVDQCAAAEKLMNENPQSKQGKGH